VLKASLFLRNTRCAISELTFVFILLMLMSLRDESRTSASSVEPGTFRDENSRPTVLRTDGRGSFPW
jgi:hypothetical protein